MHKNNYYIKIDVKFFINIYKLINYFVKKSKK